MAKIKCLTDIRYKSKSKIIVDLVTAETEKIKDGKNPAAVALERLGGLKGGRHAKKFND